MAMRAIEEWLLTRPEHLAPLDHTILSGGHPRAKAPLVLGNEGAGVVEDAGDSGLAVPRAVLANTIWSREHYAASQ
jgi:NADPH:quinone reductase-like Zn-dependent oxidoreductase